MLFEQILKRFAADLIPAILPDILRSIANQIEQGGVAQITPEMISSAMEAHEDTIKAVAAEMNS